MCGESHHCGFRLWHLNRWLRKINSAWELNENKGDRTSRTQCLKICCFSTPNQIWSQLNPWGSSPRFRGHTHRSYRTQHLKVWHVAANWRGWAPLLLIPHIMVVFFGSCAWPITTYNLRNWHLISPSTSQTVIKSESLETFVFHYLEFRLE